MPSTKKTAARAKTPGRAKTPAKTRTPAKTTTTTEKLIKLRGPFWTAEAVLLGLADPKVHKALRVLFADINVKTAGGAQLHLPGTVLLLVFVRKVVITLGSNSKAVFTFSRPSSETPHGGALAPSAIRNLLLEGKLCLLLCSTDPSKWKADFGPDDLPEATCLQGDVGLDVLTPASNARARLFSALALTKAPLGTRTGSARLVSGLTVHGSGLTALGKVKTPWQTAELTAPFQLAREIPDPSEGKPRFRLSLEDKRFTAVELAAALAAWERFARLVDPGHPAFSVPGAARPLVPRWATLEVVNPTRLPRLYWELTTSPFAPAPKSLPIKLERGELGVILADQDPRDSALPPTSVARLQPETVELVAGTDLQIKVGAGEAPGTTSRLEYSASKAASAWTEKVTLTDLATAFDPLEAARRAREAMALPAPIWDQVVPIEPSVVWAALKLEDGWAQLPVPNLTAQSYLDAALVVPPTASKPKLEGAVSLGNDKPGTLAAPSGEQPWSVTVLDAGSLGGTWTIGGGTALSKVEVRLVAPKLVIDGLFWFGNEPPSVEDPLPRLDDWLTGLRSLLVTTVDPTDTFPAPTRINFGELTLTLRPGAFPSASLAPWTARYDGHAPLLKTMASKNLLPADLFSRALPLLWRRHPTLPMVQALPLTQSQSPPSFPSPSRQLVPFELPVVLPGPAGVPLPLDWKFGTDVGVEAAQRWPRGQGPATPAREWRLGEKGADLPLVALSLPGLQLAPVVEPTAITTTEPMAGLTTQYRHDLPYADQIHALAQLPRIPKDPNRVTPPLPAEEQARERPQPLGRADFAGHFARLAEKAALAAADLVSAVVAVGGKPEVRGLAQPAVWPVASTLEAQAYPGRLTLDNATAPAAPLALSGDDALRGIDGVFVEETPGKLRRVTSGGAGFEITAGSLAAQRTTAGELRDQRGLLRSAVQVVPDKLTRTRLKLAESDPFDLTSALLGFDLAIAPDAPDGGSTWQLWFRDLALQGRALRSPNHGLDRGARRERPGGPIP